MTDSFNTETEQPRDVSPIGAKPKGIDLKTIYLGALTILVLANFALTFALVKERTSKSDNSVSALTPVSALVPQPQALAFANAHPGNNSIADIAAQAAPSVVSINIESGPSKGQTPFQFYFGQHESSGGFSKAKGSGIVVQSDGYILTNCHILSHGPSITVFLNDGRQFAGEQVKVIGTDPYTDLALLKIDATNLPVAHLGDSKTIRPGDWAIAIGSPMGFDHSVTLGIVSALGRTLEDLNNHSELIQTDAAINPGNSGGPLLNIQGQVIGINVAVNKGAQGIGFAIPVDVAKEVTESLLKEGAIKRPYLGIYMADLTPPTAMHVGLAPNTVGVIVGRSVSGSPAEKAGLETGDLILQVDGTDVKSAREVRAVVRKHKPGDVLDIVVQRHRNIEKRKLEVGFYPKDAGP